jgi:dienelactone hydrolase
MRRVLLVLVLLPLGAGLAPHARGDEKPVTTVTSIVLVGEATSMGQLLHAALVEGPVAPPAALALRPDAEVPYVARAGDEEGGALVGMNAHGVCVSLEEFPGPTTPAVTFGEQVVSPQRLVADVLGSAASVEDAAVVLGLSPMRGAARFTISDGRRLDARVVERFGRGVQQRKAFEGVLAGCDPDAGLECFLGACDPDVPRCDPAGPRGYPALRRALDPLHGRARHGDLETALLGAEVTKAPAAQVVVFEPQLLRARVGTRTAADAAATWETLDLLAKLAPERRARFAPLATPDLSGAVTRTKRTLALGGVELHDVSFRSPRPSGFEFNDTVRGVYYRPKTAKGALIALPAWKESNLVGQGLLATRLAADGFAVLVMPLPYQVDRAAPGVGSGAWTLSADLARTRAAFVQGAADVARAARWLAEEDGFGAAKVGVMGVSLGGHVAALAYGAHPQHLAAGCFLLAGGGFETALLEPNRTTGRMRERLLARGVTPEEARSLVEAIDGVTWAKPERRAGVLLVGADKDDVVPPRNVKALAAAYGDARLEWIPGDHYAILLHLGKTLDWVVEHVGAVFGEGAR